MSPGDEPAFPTLETERLFPQMGMTLREWYAGMALNGLISSPRFQPDALVAGLAYDAFAIADEMIKSVEVRRK